MMDNDQRVWIVAARDGVEAWKEPLDAEMGGGSAGGTGNSSGEEQPSLNDILGVVIEKSDLLAAYALMREPLPALEKPSSPFMRFSSC